MEAYAQSLHICGTKQAKELNRIRQDMMPKILAPEQFDPSKVGVPTKIK